MKKPLIIVVVIILVAIGGGFAYLMMQDDSGSNTVEVAETTVNETQSATPAAPGQAGTYVDYQESLIATTPGTKVLFFYASWCPQCRQLESDIKAGPLPDGTTIFKVDYDSNQALRQKYGVTLQTTLVKVDDQGKLIEKYVANDDPTLAAIQQNIL